MLKYLVKNRFDLWSTEAAAPPSLGKTNCPLAVQNRCEFVTLEINSAGAEE